MSNGMIPRWRVVMNHMLSLKTTRNTREGMDNDSETHYVQ